MTARYSIGIDRSNGSWLGVVFEDAECVDVEVQDHFSDFFGRDGRPLNRVLVDIPIGLFEAGDRSEGGQELVRDCDAMARSLLGRRHSSVFNPPARESVQKKRDDVPYDSVKTLNEEITGKGLQMQAFHISDAIGEVDRYLRENDELLTNSTWPQVLESHPELCFRALAGESLSHSKQSASGLAERLAALDRVLQSPIEASHTICSDLLNQRENKSDVDVDDVLDALVLAVVASAPDSERHPLPLCEEQSDARGLPMKMVYRAEDPLTVD